LCESRTSIIARQLRATFEDDLANALDRRLLFSNFDGLLELNAADEFESGVELGFSQRILRVDGTESVT